MRRIRKPRNGRWFAILFFLLFIISAVTSDLWSVPVLFLILALVLVFYGRNFWECEACGQLTERV